MNLRPNVLLLVIDQFRADCLHGALADHVDLPNLRAFMTEAVSFRRHYSVASPCGPSRASILTGQYAMNHRVIRNGTPLPHDTPNIAGEMRKGGYLPLLFGYTDSTVDPRVLAPGDPALTSYEQVMPGFVEALEMRLEESWPWRAHLKSRGYQVPDGAAIFRPVGNRPDDPALYRAEDSDTAFLTDRFLADIAVRPAGWFAHLTYIRPHPPLVAPAPYNRMYDPGRLPPPVCPLDLLAERASHAFNAAVDPSVLVHNVVGFPDLPATPANIASLRAIYLGLATEVDHHVGRVIEFLKSTGQYDDTLIVITADHGEMLGDRHIWGKTTYYDAAYHVPLILRDPRAPERFGQLVHCPTESVDVAPTILDLLGLDIPDTMNGRSLRPLLTGSPPANWRDYSFSELDFGNPLTPTSWQIETRVPSDRCNLSILRGPRHTLVHFNGDLPQILFDHDSQGEAFDIASNAEAQAILLTMSRRLLDHRMTHAQGRFTWTMITPDGVKRGQRPTS